MKWIRKIGLIWLFVCLAFNATQAQQIIDVNPVEEWRITPASFGIFQTTLSSVVPTADIVCTITTGNCVGTGGGSSVFTAATCNGIADDANAFISYHTFATTWQSTHVGLLMELDIPSGKTCEFGGIDSNHNKIAQGLKVFQLVGYGAEFGDLNGTGGGFALGGGGGIQFNGTSSTVRLATVTAGSSSITVLDTSKCSLWNNGDWAVVTGIDPQGFGDPPNPQILQYVQILSTASCAGSGIITITSPLIDTYKSTWPVYNAGDILHSDDGGPATLYQLVQDWDATQVYYGLKINQASGQTNAIGRDITFRDATCPIAFCVIPSQNKIFRAINFQAAGSSVEIDKVVENVIMDNVAYRRLIFQSGGVNFSCNNCTVGPIGISGTSKSTIITNSNITDLSIGTTSYGGAGSFSATNSLFTTFGLSGSGMSQVDARGVWSSIGFTVPQNFSILGSSDNGSGLTRLTVNTTAGWTTGIVTDISSSRAIDTASLCNSTSSLTVIDPTHFDISGSSSAANNVSVSIASPAVVTKTAHGFAINNTVVFGNPPTGLTAGTTYFIIASGFTTNAFEVSATLGGAAINTSGSPVGQAFLQCVGNAGSLPLTWATPGYYVYFSSGQAPLGPILRVADLAVGANASTVVSFTLNGSAYTSGFPTMPGTPGTFRVTTHPAPLWSCVSCTGSPLITDTMGGPAGPYGSYAQRIVTTANSGSPIQMPIFGQLTELDILVTAACSGASNIGFEQTATTMTLGSSVFGSWNPTANALISNATPRKVFPTTSSGAQSGDVLTAPGAGTWLVYQQQLPFYSNVGNCASASTTVTIKTDQGVTFP